MPVKTISNKTLIKYQALLFSVTFYGRSFSFVKHANVLKLFMPHYKRLQEDFKTVKVSV